MFVSKSKFIQKKLYNYFVFKYIFTIFQLKTKRVQSLQRKFFIGGEGLYFQNNNKVEI